MAINDFSAIIQLAATISIAFVAVEYVKSFTCILCEKFFNFYDFVKDSFKECRDILTDKDTLSHIEAVDVGGKSTITAIEEAKRQNESLSKEIDEEEKRQQEEISKVCEARSMSSICFFVFLFNTMLLIVGGLENRHPFFIHYLSLIFNLLGIIYLMVGWFTGERKDPYRFLDFASLRHPIFGFVVVFTISSAVSLILFNYCKDYTFEYIEDIWWYVLVVSIVFTYLNFIVFVFKIRSKAHDFMSNVASSKENLKNKCKAAEKDVEDLMGTTRLMAKLRAD